MKSDSGVSLHSPEFKCTFSSVFCVAMYLTNSNGSIQGRDEEQASDPHDVWGWTGSRYGGTSCWAQTVLWWAVFVTAQCSWHHTGLQMDTQRGFVHLDAISQQVKNALSLCFRYICIIYIQCVYTITPYSSNTHREIVFISAAYHQQPLDL